MLQKGITKCEYSFSNNKCVIFASYVLYVWYYFVKVNAIIKILYIHILRLHLALYNELYNGMKYNLQWNEGEGIFFLLKKI